MTNTRQDEQLLVEIRVRDARYPRNPTGFEQDWRAQDRRDLLRLLDKAQTVETRIREALESIARNTCCEQCQEAARVARSALYAVAIPDPAS